MTYHGVAPARRFWATGVAALVLLVLATRLPFMTQTPYAFDSANFALAVRDDFNVAFHRPHPPGYPLYVAGGRLLYPLVGDANRALVLFGVLLSAAAVAATAALGRMLLGAGGGLLAGLLLTFTVGFWGYGEVAYAYVGLAAEMAVLAALSHAVLAGRSRLALPLGLAVGVAAGIRWDGAVFCAPLWLWALWRVSWRLRIASLAVAAAVVVSWAVPTVLLSGGPAAYAQAVNDYLRAWSPQSAFVVGEFESGRETQATYNLNFLVNYGRQMLGVGVLLALVALSRRLAPTRLASDYRARFLALWVTPPLLTYVFTHLGEAGYVLSLAPAAAILAAAALQDLAAETATATGALRARGWRWLPSGRAAGMAVAALLAAGVLGWNVQAFLRGVGPGRLPDLRARDATTLAQLRHLSGLPPASTLVLAHDSLRQLEYALPGHQVRLHYSEYVPGWQEARTRTPLPPGVERVVVLDGPLRVPPEDQPRVREVVLAESPRVVAWHLDTAGAGAVEHGYRFARLLPP